MPCTWQKGLYLVCFTSLLSWSGSQRTSPIVWVIYSTFSKDSPGIYVRSLIASRSWKYIFYGVFISPGYDYCVLVERVYIQAMIHQLKSYRKRFDGVVRPSSLLPYTQLRPVRNHGDIAASLAVLFLWGNTAMRSMSSSVDHQRRMHPGNG